MYDLPLIEQSLIAYLLKNQIQICEINNYFVSKISKDFYEAMLSLNERGYIVNKENLLVEGVRRNELINKEKIDLLFNYKFDEHLIADYIKNLKDYFLQEQLRTEVGANIISALDTKAKPDIPLLKEEFSKAQNLILQIENTDKIIKDVDDIFDEYGKEIDKRAEHKGYHSTGDPYLDAVFPQGLDGGYMTTIFGSSGTGKSTLGLHLKNCQINRAIPLIDNTLEMGVIATMDRKIARRRNIPYEYLMADDYDEEKYEEIKRILVEERMLINATARYRMIETDTESISDLDYMIPKIQKALDTEYLVLHIDLATMLRDFNGGGDKQSTVYEKAGNSLSSLAKRHNIHIINYVQALRDDKKTQIKKITDIKKFRPRLDSIKNSAIFEERSRVIIGLFRAKYYADRYLKDDPMTSMLDDIMEVTFLKQTMGTLPMLRYLFDGATATTLPYINNDPDDDIYFNILNGNLYGEED